MNLKSLKSKFAIAFVAQTVSLFVSFFATFFLSKRLSVEAYGYYQLFLFFSTYAGIFQLGISQGVYLSVAGKEYGKLEKRWLKGTFLQGFILQLLLLLMVVLFSQRVTSPADKAKVILFFASYCIIYLIQNYWGGILQSVNRSECFSLATIVGKSVTFILFIILSVLGNVNFAVYCTAYLTGELVSALVDMFYCRDIIFCRICAADIFKFDFSLYSSGFILLLSTIMSSLIVGINRIIVENTSGIESFGKVSMSFSLSNFISLFAIQIGLVLFPNFVNMSQQEQRRNYQFFEVGITLLAPVIFIVYYPMQLILCGWLPSYMESIRWILLLIPYTVFEIKSQILYNNMEKAYRDEKYLFLTNLIAIAICALVNSYSIGKLGDFDLMFLVMDVAVALRTIMLSRRICGNLSVSVPIWSALETFFLIAVSYILFRNYSFLFAVLLVPVYLVYGYCYYKALKPAE